MPPKSSQNRKRQRKIDHYTTADKKYYIFCEGVQTEPLYFRGFEKAIKSNPMYQNAVHVEVQGIGAETLRVIYAAEKYVSAHDVKNAEIWCVYDKDSFPAQDFNAVSLYAEELNKAQTKVSYFVAWSNQCIEYWFILHFDWYYANNDRPCYRAYLHNKFALLGYVRYEKNNPKLFDILTKRGDPKQAIQRAERRLTECSGQTDTNSAPATKVHLLVKKLAEYLPEDLRKRYI